VAALATKYPNVYIATSELFLHGNAERVFGLSG
jgi:hypothetical protein